MASTAPTGVLMLQEWTDPPPMSAAAPAPAVLCSEATLWLAYRIARDPHHCAVVRFEAVERYGFGEPPAALGVESLNGLARGSFYEVPGTGTARRWLVTFPDAILEVRARSGNVVLRATALSPAHALAALLDARPQEE
jgi:hypothetical protein